MVNIIEKIKEHKIEHIKLLVKEVICIMIAPIFVNIGKFVPKLS